MAKRQPKMGKQTHGPGNRAAAMMPGEKADNFKGTMKQLLSYLAKYKIRLAIVLLFAIASTVFAVVSPTILGNATNEVVKGLMGTGIDYGKLGNIIFLLIGLYAISFAFSFAQGFIMAKVSQEMTYTFRRKLSEKMDRLPIKYFDGMTKGEYQSRVINDIETVNQSLSQSITQSITSFVTIIGTLVMMVRISLLMTLAALLVLPLSMTVIKLVVGKSQGHFKNQQKYLGQVNSHVEEMYTGHMVVKVFNKESESQRTFDDMNGNLYESAWKSQFLSGIMMPATMLIGNLGYVVVCLLGGYLAIHGGVSVQIFGMILVLSGAVNIGDIQAFIQYVRNFNQPLQQVANVANLLQSTAAAAERVFEVIGEEEEKDPFRAEGEKTEERGGDVATGSAEECGDVAIESTKEGGEDAIDSAEECSGDVAIGLVEESTNDGTSGSAEERTGGGTTGRTDSHVKTEGRVDFDHVSFGYVENEPVIKDFSFTAQPGQRIAIVGPTGAGKTTIVKLLLRYYELNGGRILVDDKDITAYSRKDLRDRFGMVLQDTWLFSGTLRENLKYGRPLATDEEMIKAAKAAKIHHFIMTQPEGYDTMINGDADNISAGQKQLVTIARAMLADNPILILDEATSSVDTRTERQIQEAMSNLMKGRTSFVIAHRLSTIKDADNILVLDKGDIVEKGTHQELLAKGGFYANLYNAQFEK